MRKLLIIFLLIILNIFAYLYLNSLISSRKPFLYEPNNESIFFQTKPIELIDKDDFVFENHFEIISLGDKKYDYSINDEAIEISINNCHYKFNYEILEPEIIEKVIYKEIDSEIKNEVICEEVTYFNVNNDYLSFELNTDLEIIRTILVNNLNTTYQTSIDYSRLNISQKGQYLVSYISDEGKIDIIVEII